MNTSDPVECDLLFNQLIEDVCCERVPMTHKEAVSMSLANFAVIVIHSLICSLNMATSLSHKQAVNDAQIHISLLLLINITSLVLVSNIVH